MLPSSRLSSLGFGHPTPHPTFHLTQQAQVHLVLLGNAGPGLLPARTGTSMHQRGQLAG